MTVYPIGTDHRMYGGLPNRYRVDCTVNRTERKAVHVQFLACQPACYNPKLQCRA